MYILSEIIHLPHFCSIFWLLTHKKLLSTCHCLNSIHYVKDVSNLKCFLSKNLNQAKKKWNSIFLRPVSCLLNWLISFLFVPGLRYPLHTCMFLQLSSFFYCFSSYSHFHLKYKSLSFFLGTSQKDVIFEVSATSTIFFFFFSSFIISIVCSWVHRSVVKNPLWKTFDLKLFSVQLIFSRFFYRSLSLTLEKLIRRKFNGLFRWKKNKNVWKL